MVAFEWFLLCVDVCVLFQVLCQSKGLEAESTDMLLHSGVGGDVSPEGEASSVGLVAAIEAAGVWFFHCVFYCFIMRVSNFDY